MFQLKGLDTKRWNWIHFLTVWWARAYPSTPPPTPTLTCTSLKLLIDILFWRRGEIVWTLSESPPPLHNTPLPHKHIYGSASVSFISEFTNEFLAGSRNLLAFSSTQTSCLWNCLHFRIHRLTYKDILAGAFRLI